jgi:hypothetical protein
LTVFERVVYFEDKGGTTMAVKKTVTAKKPATKRAPAKKAVSKGQSFECEVCGLAVTVNEACGCIETCDILCCSQPMKEKKAKAKPKAKAAAKKK